MRLATRRALCLAVSLLAALPASAQVKEWSNPYERQLELPLSGESFRQPRAVHADLHTGEVFVCDTFNNRLSIFDHRGLFKHQIVGGDVFRTPLDLAVDAVGRLFLLAPTGRGLGILLLDFDGKPLGQVRLEGLPEDLPVGSLVSIALSADGERLFILDEANQRLWIATREGEILGSVDLAADLEPEEAEEQILGHVDVYGGRVLVAIPTRGAVWMFDLNGNLLAEIGIRGTSPCQTAFPVAAALDADGNVLVLDKQRALFMSWRPADNKCLAEFSGFGTVPGALYQPDDFSLDDSGNLYVTQGFESRLQVYRAETTAPPLVEALSWTAPPARVASPGLEEQRGGPTSRPDDLAAKSEQLRAELAASERSRAELDDLLAEARQENRQLAQSVARLQDELRAHRPAAGQAEAEAPADPGEPEAARAVAELVHRWSRAWSEQQVDEYLGFYGAAFQPPRGAGRQRWQDQRRERLTRPRFIELTVTDLRVELDGPRRARATFDQEYRSDRFSDKVRKTLVLSREESGWRIVDERVDEAP